MSKILLIDDDIQVNEVIRTTLEFLGHTVGTVDTAEAAPATFSAFNPDVTLVDYMLPGHSGLDILRELGRHRPAAVRYLATGMADFRLLKQAIEAGATSMLSKPYRVNDLVALVELAKLLDDALKNETTAECSPGVLHWNAPAGAAVSAEDLGRIVAFARTHGAIADVAERKLPLVACELLKNAGQHAAQSDYAFRLALQGTQFRLTVEDCGPGFEWQRTLARARGGMDKPRASGLQIVLALTDDLCFENGGRIVHAQVGRDNGGSEPA